MTTIIKPLYGASAALASTTLQSLASGATTFWSSAVIDNSSNLSDDEIVTWKITAGTAPAAGTTGDCWMWEMMDDSVYPDTITGADAAVTLTSVNVKLGFLKYAGSITFDSTSARVYYNTRRVLEVFQGLAMPKKWGVGFSHVSTVALAASGNVVTRIPVQFQNV